MSVRTDDIDFSLPLLRTLFDSLNEGIMVWNSGGALEYANEAARAITRLPLVVGDHLKTESQRVSILDERNAQAPIASTPVFRAFRGEDVPPESMRYIDADGTHRWLQVSASRILGQDGSLRYVMSTVRDISLRKSREEKLRFMVESAKILSLNLDFDERLVEKAKLTVPALADWCTINVLRDGQLRRVTVIHGDATKKTLLESMDEKYPRDGMLSLIQNREPVFIRIIDEEALRAMATSPEHLEDLRKLELKSLLVIPIVSRGEGVGAMTLAYGDSGRTYDESDLEFFQEFCYHISVIFDNARLFEEISRRDKAKDLFLASLSHELRNPLAPIKSSLELLKLRESTQDVREEIDIIEHHFNHMAKLLNDLLDVSRFTQDRISLSTQPIDLRRLIERALRGTDAQIRQADITLHYAYPSGSLSVIADETRLEQAVSNLLSNAVKFTPAGGSIWMELERDADHAIIRVRDNGEGIDSEDLPNIFNMYYQGRVKGRSSGLGIGLLMVERIVNLHNGSVAAYSEGRGKGSEFVIRLPLAEVDIPESGSSASPAGARALRILVVDDNAPAADALVRLLNKIGSEADAAYSGHDALGKAQLHLYDLFLLDVGMPHMDGYELVAALRSRGISAPIVALTGYGLAEDKARALGAGFTSHLTKPVGLSELNQLFDTMFAAIG